jgi:multidrug efflux pump subunit AcrA (membrane-fusion protein)
LATLDSPAWRDLQHSAVEAEGDIRVAEAAVQVAKARLAEVEKSAAFLSQRIEKLATANVRQIDLESQLSDMRNQQPRLAAEVNAAEVGLEEANEHYLSRLRTISSVTGVAREALLAEVEVEGELRPFWHTIEKLEICAEAGGVVDTVEATNGGWLETGAHALSTVNPSAIRFAAQAPQADMPLFSSGQKARIVPPEGGSIGNGEAMSATIHVGAIGHSEERVIPLYAEAEILAAWAKPGIGAYLEVITGAAKAQLAIPEAALVRDELDLVYFKRNPKDSNEALKVKADLGVSDGKWVAVKSGVTDGEEVVVEGAYALKLAGSKSTAPPGYHYHADGSLHKDH